MALQKADLFGLAIGFALGGAALALFLPRIEAMVGPATPRTSQAGAPPGTSTPPREIAEVPPPAPMPSIETPAPPPDEAEPPPLPAVVVPSHPSNITGKSGTGFFIAVDGSLLTAAHVVSGCRRTEIVSRTVKPTAVELVASDATQDIALLHAHVRPPATLPLGPPLGRSTADGLLVLGYPPSAGRLIPAETSATLENARFPASAGPLADPRQMVWIEAAAVTHGYSGGPILDLGNGAVVGIVKGMIDVGRLRSVPGMPRTGVVAGPGSGRLASFVRDAAPYLDTGLPGNIGDAAADDARHATVHVICWY